ncbi:MAG: ATP-binding protein, partial [Actinomycetota bacterium]
HQGVSDSRLRRRSNRQLIPGTALSTVEIEIPSKTAYVGVVRLALASLARAAGLDEETVDDMKIAVGEACANAVLANEEAGVGASVSVHWDLEPERIVIEVGDRGAGPGQEDEQEDTLGVASRAVMSMALLDQLVDECELLPRPEGGTTARLVVFTPR